MLPTIGTLVKSTVSKVATVYIDGKFVKCDVPAGTCGYIRRFKNSVSKRDDEYEYKCIMRVVTPEKKQSIHVFYNHKQLTTKLTHAEAVSVKLPKKILEAFDPFEICQMFSQEEK